MKTGYGHPKMSQFSNSTVCPDSSFAMILITKKIEMKKLISWVEIPAADFERAVTFYRNVFKMDLQPVEGGDEKMVCFPGGEGAISFAPGFKPGKNGALVSLNVENDMAGAIERINANGGTIVKPKTKIEAEGRGYFAVFIDCEGNKIGLYGEE